MKISVISGSHRAHSESERIAQFIGSGIEKKGVSSHLISLAHNPLPLWDEEAWGAGTKWDSLWAPISQELASSDGFVVVSPEWGGMVPAGLKNFFLLASKNELAHKPAMIVGVSSGISGSYPIAELRMSSYKNSRILYIPDHIIVRTAPKMLQGETTSDKHDQSLRDRINYNINVLIEYAKALKAVRNSGVIDYTNYPFGM